MWALNASCTWLLHPHLATYCVEQDVHICMKLKGRERPQCQTGYFTSLLLLEQTCKMQIERQRKPPRRDPARRGISLSMYSPHQNVHAVNSLSACYLPLSVWVSSTTWLISGGRVLTTNRLRSSRRRPCEKAVRLSFSVLLARLPLSHSTPSPAEAHGHGGRRQTYANKLYAALATKRI